MVRTNKLVSNGRWCTGISVTQKALKRDQELSPGGRGMFPTPAHTPPWASEVVIDVPDVPAQRVGCPLQRPGKQGQLAPEAALLEAQAPCHLGGGGPGAAGAQQPHVVQKRAERVVSATQEDVTERGLGRRHVLGQEVELHLRREGDRVEVRTAVPNPPWDLKNAESI